MDLPPELLSIICSFLHKFDLKVVRQVCQKLNHAAVPLLFNLVYITADRADLANSRLIGQRFGPHVRKLIFVAKHYYSYTRSKHDTAVLSNGHIEATPEELEASYAEYCAQRREWRELTSIGEDVLHLSNAFFTMPNIERVCVSDGLAIAHTVPDWTSSQELREERMKKTWLRPASPFNVCHDSPMEDKEEAWRPFLMIMCAISLSGQSIKHISLPLPMDTFDQSPQNLQHLVNVLQHVQTLSMSLSSYYGFAQEEGYFKQGKVAQILGAAKNLRSLCLYMDAEEDYTLNGTSFFSAILRDCEFPMLKILCLQLLRFTEDEIVSFLCLHSSTLARFAIDGANLDSGSWKSLLDCTQEKLRLVCVTMTQLYDGFEAPWDGIEWVDHGEVEAFYTGNGGNPFTSEALEIRYPGGLRPRQIQDL